MTNPSHEKVLHKIRALLAKAESTSFEEEAESFMAKAQELMARHSIDTAMFASDGADSPIRVEIGIEDPYWSSKATLLWRVASANRCESIRLSYDKKVAVIGFPVDIDNVDMLFTSLLVQATAAMAKHGSKRNGFGESTTRSFRKSFLDGFALRIGQRLAEATQHVEDEVVNGDTLPVLASRSEEVSRVFGELYPDVTKIRPSFGCNVDGFRAGQAAANAARLTAQGRTSA